MHRSMTGATLLALLLLAGPAQAQLIGLKLGTTWSTLEIDGGAEPDALRRLAGGGFVRVGGRFGVQLELLSAVRGAVIRDSVGGDFDLELQYLELPVLLHVPIGSSARFAPYVFAGPVPAIELDCDVVYAAGGSEDCSAGATDIFERAGFDLGLAAGAGFAVAAGPGAFLLEARYTAGLTDIDSDGDAVVKPRSAALLAGYTVNLRLR